MMENPIPMRSLTGNLGVELASRPPFDPLFEPPLEEKPFASFYYFSQAHIHFLAWRRTEPPRALSCTTLAVVLVPTISILH